MPHSVMVWTINCQPSPRVSWLVLSWSCLPTQLMAPDSVNMVSHASPKLSPSPNDCHPYNRMTWPGLVTTASVRSDLPSQTMSSTTRTCQVCWGCSHPFFGRYHLYFQTILSLMVIRCWFPYWRLGW